MIATAAGYAVAQNPAYRSTLAHLSAILLEYRPAKSPVYYFFYRTALKTSPSEGLPSGQILSTFFHKTAENQNHFC